MSNFLIIEDTDMRDEPYIIRAIPLCNIKNVIPYAVKKGDRHPRTGNIAEKDRLQVTINYIHEEAEYIAIFDPNKQAEFLKKLEE